MANDAHHVAAPDPDGTGAARAMTAALRDAGLGGGDIAHVNAHATSTPAGDVAEATAIRLTFGEHTDEVPVTATKSYTGHLLGAAGALEAAIACLSVRDRVVPAIRNLDDPDDDVALDMVRVTNRDLPAGTAALSNSFGFGGHDVALVVGAA
jgi:3-oxoacyl-[acyl-carrier-protein] synthase II